jgi:hypothetical protein
MITFASGSNPEDSVKFSVTIPEGNYTMTNLIPALNTALNNEILSNPTLTTMFAVPVPGFLLNTTTSRVMLNCGTWRSGSAPANNPPVVIWSPTFDLARILGFSHLQRTRSTVSSIPVGINYTITANNTYNLSYDTYLGIQIENIITSMFSTQGNTVFKLPVNVSTNSIFYYNENTFSTQRVELLGKEFQSISYLRIRVVDQNAIPLNNNGLDWSFTLRIEKE